ncbi:MAG: glycosyltransferase, partial [Bdellovibrionales bacterium]|nr:glycosyltransferase [Bdellovibrionales bacterium]
SQGVITISLRPLYNFFGTAASYLLSLLPVGVAITIIRKGGRMSRAILLPTLSSISLKSPSVVSYRLFRLISYAKLLHFDELNFSDRISFILELASSDLWRRYLPLSELDFLLAQLKMNHGRNALIRALWHVNHTPFDQIEAKSALSSLIRSIGEDLSDREISLFMSLVEEHAPELLFSLRNLDVKTTHRKIFYEGARILRNQGWYEEAFSVISLVEDREDVEFGIALKTLIESELCFYKDGMLWPPAPTVSYIPKPDSILFLLEDALPWKRTGYTVRSQHLLSALQQQGTLVTPVVRPGLKTADIAIDFRHSTSSLFYHATNESLDTNFRKIPLHAFFAAYLEGTMSIALEKRPHVIHAVSNFKQAVVADRLSALLNIPWVYELRGLWEESQVTLGTIVKSSDRFRFFREQENLALIRANAVVTLSVAMKGHLVDRGISPDKIFVVPNGIPTTFVQTVQHLKPRHTSSLFRVGYFGSLNSYENLDTLVQALQFLPEYICLRIIGDGREKSNLAKLTKELELESRIEILPPVAAESLPDLVGDINAFVLLRKEDIVTELVPPMKLLEMLAFRKSLILSRRTVFQEMVPSGSDVMWIDNIDPVSVAAGIQNIFDKHSSIPEIDSTSRAPNIPTWDEIAQLYHPVWRYAHESFANAEHTLHLPDTKRRPG